jgi:hypothetical protein
MDGLDWSNSSTVRTRLVGWYMITLFFHQSSLIISQTRTDSVLLVEYTLLVNESRKLQMKVPPLYRTKRLDVKQHAAMAYLSSQQKAQRRNAT